MKLRRTRKTVPFLGHPVDLGMSAMCIQLHSFLYSVNVYRRF